MKPLTDIDVEYANGNNLADLGYITDLPGAATDRPLICSMLVAPDNGYNLNVPILLWKPMCCRQPWLVRDDNLAINFLKMPTSTHHGTSHTRVCYWGKGSVCTSFKKQVQRLPTQNGTFPTVDAPGTL